ncbi:MAG: nitrite reductase small subunit NirD [Candidatus Nitricoxidivorans perseverans]|uniref:Nitrite reductase small subunit NirD n=1 Tax=Candidatus Nitricoxidivorans perseverans TaxID=2975601 RepID=A0AA49IT34_9PROT|nr:MAG: nitrite reductase small subunit NirD [Candidatus Nitricoxidivorans perseverans]
MNIEKTEWIDLCAIDDIPRQGGRALHTPMGELAIFRTVDDRLFALDGKCPHRGGPLSQGMVHGHRVTCPLHGLNIDLDTGEAIAPDSGCVRKHPLRGEAGRVLIGVVREPVLAGA